MNTSSNIEIWLYIPNYNNDYQISNRGNVKSFKRLASGELLKSIVNVNGYRCVGLSNKGVVKKWLVHQLVALSFIDPNYKSKKLVVDHISGWKLNNHLENLQVITQRENVSRSTRDKATGVFKTKTGKYKAESNINRKRKYLGTFETIQDAQQAYNDYVGA